MASSRSSKRHHNGTLTMYDQLAHLSSMDNKLVSAAQGETQTAAQAVLIHGDDGSVLRPLAVDSSGHLEVNFSGEGALATESTLSSINTKTPSQGQAAMASSVPVAIASDQTAVPVSGTVSVSGVATESTLSSINTKTPSQGQAAMASSVPVAIATDQSAVPVSGTVSVSGVATESTLSSIDSKITACNTGAVVVSSSALPSGAATSANQSIANGSLGIIAGDSTSIDGKMAASGPITSNGTTSAQQVHVMGSSDGTNFRTLKTSGAGVLKTEETLQWSTTSIFNSTINFGNNSNTSTFNLGSDIHVPADLLIFITNSANTDTNIVAYLSPDNVTFFPTYSNTTVQSNGDVVLSLKNEFNAPIARYLMLNIENASADTNSTYTVTIGEYNGS